MQQDILSKLESSRKELLDLGMRNSLLNYRTPLARGLRIVQERSASLFDILVREGKAMTFLPQDGKKEEGESFQEQPQLSESEQQAAENDTKLQTNESEQKLQTKILNTYYFSRSSIEEQGVNILYLAAGMLNWYEKGNTETVRSAPLILIPVYLERSTASERFRLRYSGAEIGANLSLQAKMLADYNISIPELGEPEEIDVPQYYDLVKERIAHQQSWSVDEDAVELGFFSFGKFMLYNDLDSENWPEQRKPYDHPIIQALFSDGFNEPPQAIAEDAPLDAIDTALAVQTVVDADSSQIIAMLGVNEGRNMVIQGPPGTGKSQTIANLIADSLGKGKKILFVAEKMAALEVVKRRLDNIHLGMACLELHSHKANKKSLHDELKRVLDLGKPTLQHLEDEIKLLDPIIKQLNDYCGAINSSIQQSGKSSHEIIGRLITIGQDFPDYRFPDIAPEGMVDWTPAKMKEVELLAEQIEARLQAIGDPKKLLFHGSGLLLLLPADEKRLQALLSELLEADRLFLTLKKEASTLMMLETPNDQATYQVLIDHLKQATVSPSLDGFPIENSAWLNSKEEIGEAIKSGLRLSQLHDQYASVFIPEAWQQDLLLTRQHLLSHGRKWYKFLIGSYKNSVNQLGALLTVPIPKSLDDKLKYVEAIMEAKRLSRTLESATPLLKEIAGSNWQGLKSNWQQLDQAFQFLSTTHSRLQSRSIHPNFLQYLRQAASPAMQASALLSQLNEADTARKVMITSLFQTLRFEGQISSLADAEQTDKFYRWNEQLPELHKAVQWNVLREHVSSQQADYLLDAIADWDDASTLLKTALQKSWYDKLLEHSILGSAALRRFERASHEDIIARFIRLDILKQHYNRATIALHHYENLPRMDAGGQINVLRGEFNRKARHMPIRKLIKEAGHAIQAIKPVIMMSPMSIASFLPPDSIEFDLVIFDEASQVRPVDALGAIMRGKQIVVVGDIKQMPPTSFFDKMNTDIDEQENVTADMQSILGMCDAQGAPQAMLRWHYRSRHESLISLSNQEFYENKLVIFPSPGSKDAMGLRFHHLPHTHYDKGKTRANSIEAECVAEAVVNHAKRFPKQTLGVVAFSTPQMQAIIAALELRRRRDPEIEHFFRSHGNEPFFVKNLENVQGDERDVIFISIGYGRTQEGTLSMNFGPLNNEGGERRLNVLITRAKMRCEIFANIKAEDIIVGPTTKFGIRALKSFLYFAEHAKFEREKGMPDETPQYFEEVVAEALEGRGYMVRRRIGTAGYFMDLAVLDPEHPGRYILGINCDGRSYASPRTARDRDRLRKEVLEGMGWQLQQVWSMDWFRNPAQELQRLVDRIEQAKVKAEADDHAQREVETELEVLVRESKEETNTVSKLPLYEKAVLPAQVAQKQINNFSTQDLATWIEHIVLVEGPIHFDEVTRRIVESNGLSKLSTNVRTSLAQALEVAEKSGSIVPKDNFLWHRNSPHPVARDRSTLSRTSKKIFYIAPQELISVLLQIVKDAIAITPDHAIALLAKNFGFSRVTDEIKQHLLSLMHDAIADGLLVNDAEFVRLKG